MYDRDTQIRWPLAAATTIGFILAIFVGATIANSDYLILIFVGTLIILVAYVVHFQRYTWQIALLTCYLGLSFRPAGFQFSSLELTAGLGLWVIAATIWQKRSLEKRGILNDSSFDLLRLLLFLWIVYLAVHMLYNIKSPFRPADFALKNALKSYFAAAVPAILLLYFSRRPAGIRAKGNILKTVIVLMLTGVITNLLITFYRILTHHDIVDPDADLQTMTFLIPGINAVENFYTLRTLGPAAILFGATALSLGPATAGVSRRLSLVLLLAGSVGSILSGGRAAVATSVFLVLAMLLLTKRIAAFWMTLLVAGLLVVAVNVSSGWLDRNAPVPVSRALQWVMVSKNKKAESSIESSSQWREELFKRAIEEWRSNSRIFWLGRATYGYGVSDYVAMQVYGSWEAGQESSLRRGATHNLIADLLVTYGLIGCILYYCVILAIIRFLWTAYRSTIVSKGLKPLVLVCLIAYVSYLATASVAGGLYSPETIWLLILLIAALDHDSTERVHTETTTPSFELLSSHVR
jgi:hypothetical protein